MLIMRTVHYICHYNEIGRRIIVQPSGVSKINYIKSVLLKANYEVRLLSLAEGESKPSFFIYPSLVVQKGTREHHRYISTMCRSNILFRIASRLWMYVQLLSYLFFSVRQNEPILIYHSLAYVFPIRVFRFFSKKKLYFEVEELFHAAYKDSTMQIENEKKYLRKASGYILVNDLISNLSGFSAPNVVCYGVYSRKNMPNISFNDGKIHLIYAGVINEDALMAVEISKYLSDKYHIHILGYGIEPNIVKLEREIENVSLISQCAVSYDGCKFGEEYMLFLAKCSMGICTRVLEDSLSDYTFPSKVLAYISCGLLPVCSHLTCIKESKIYSHVLFARQVTPDAFAEAIMSVDTSFLCNYDNSFLDQLDLNLISELRSLFN